MGKILIGSTLGEAIAMILRGMVSREDVGKIYTHSGFLKDEIRNYINGDDSWWECVAENRAYGEVAAEYDVEEVWNIKDDKDRQEAYKKVQQKKEILIGEVYNEAEELLRYLCDTDKIVNTSTYEISRKQNEFMVQSTPRQIEGGYPEQFKVVEEDSLRIKAIIEGRIPEEFIIARGTSIHRIMVCINGEFFIDSNHDSELELGEGEIFDDELQALAGRLTSKFNFSKGEERVTKTRQFFMQKIFPQYESEISQVCEKINTYNHYLSRDEILDLFHEALRQTGEHTAEEIGEGVKDLTPGELGEAITVITDISEPEKDPHSLE